MHIAILGPKGDVVIEWDTASLARQILSERIADELLALLPAKGLRLMRSRDKLTTEVERAVERALLSFQEETTKH